MLFKSDIFLYFSGVNRMRSFFECTETITGWQTLAYNYLSNYKWSWCFLCYLIKLLTQKFSKSFKAIILSTIIHIKGLKIKKKNCGEVGTKTRTAWLMKNWSFFVLTEWWKTWFLCIQKIYGIVGITISYLLLRFFTRHEDMKCQALVTN